MSFMFGSQATNLPSAPPQAPLDDAKKELLAAKSSTSLVRISPAAVKLSGRRTASQRRKRGPTERLFSNETPVQWINPRSDNTVYKIVQGNASGTAASSSSANTYSQWYYSLGNLDQASSLAAVFDQYRITKIEIMFMPRVSAVAASTSLNTGVFSTVVDYDDASALTTLAQAQDYANVISSPGSVGHYRVFEPHVAVAAYSGSFSSYANETSPWIDCASTSVQHYGVKTAWSQTDAVYTYDVYAHLWLEFRNVR